MSRFGSKVVGAIIAGTLPSWAAAQGAASPSLLPQSTSAADASASNVPASTVGGTQAMDIIALRPTGPATPLRFGNVVPQSEQVELNGRILTRGTDYGMDYASGVVYLMCAQKEGQSLTVTYRYSLTVDPKAAAAASPMAALTSMKFSVMPSMNMIMGMGLAERASDGTVLTSNVYGWNNSFAMGQGKLNGLMVLGDRQKSNDRAGLQMDASAKPGSASTDVGQSRFMVQDFASKFMGGTMQLGYQDISKNFAGFSAVSGSGMDDASLKKYQSEKGLTRMGFGLQNAQLGGLNLTDTYREVKDGSNSIQWWNYGLAQGGLKFNLASQKVSQGFTRFKDISEADRDQLAKEMGTSRQSLAAEFAQKAGKISFKDSTIQDDGTGQGIARRELALDTSNIKFDLGNQSVTNGFSRIDSLLADEKNLYGKDAGLKRQWVSVQAAFLGKATPFNFSQSSIEAGTAKYRAEDFSAGNKTWSLAHIERSTDAAFTNLAALSDADTDASVKAIASMYGTGIATSANDRAAFRLGTGLSRSFNQMNLQPAKGWNLAFSDLEMKGQLDHATLETITVGNNRFGMNFRRQYLGSRFNELTSTMAFEQKAFGTTLGLDRTDFGLNLDLGRSRKLTVSDLSAAYAQNESAQRTNIGYQDKKVDLAMSRRTVSAGFLGTQLTDSESDLLTRMAGYKEEDVRLKWQIASNMKLDLANMAFNDGHNPLDTSQHAAFDWAPNKNTQFSFSHASQSGSNPLVSMYGFLTDQLSFNENFGRYGKLALLDARKEFNDSTGAQKDSHQQYLSYEAKVNDHTSLKTEESITTFDDGTRQDVSANTVSTSLSKRAGVSLTESVVDGNGTTNDEAKSNYGFWVDLGNGMRLNYGYNRDLQSANTSTMNSTVSLGKNPAAVGSDKLGTLQAGQVGSVMLDGGYGVNQWDALGTAPQRTQAFSNLSLSSAKPMNYGPFKQVKFNFGMDTASDYTKFTRDNEAFGISSMLGANTLGYSYKYQVDPVAGRGIDRSMLFQTDQSDKRRYRASISYKIRTLPTDQDLMIRDISLTAKLTKNFELTNQVQTNPDVPNSSALLGSLPQASRSNKWKLDYTHNADCVIGGSWEELFNTQTQAKSTTGGLNLKMFSTKGSPVTLFYGMQENEGNVTRKLVQRYQVQFDQRPGPNQTFSLFLGNISYDYSLDSGMNRNNWTARLNYQYRF